MPDEIRITLGDDDVAFLRADRQLRQQLRTSHAVGDYHQAGIDAPASSQRHALRIDCKHVVDQQLRTALLRLCQQQRRAFGRIHDRVARHPQTAREAGAQMRLNAIQVCGIQQFAADAVRSHSRLLGGGGSHFLGIGGHPERAARAEFILLLATVDEFAPQFERITGQRQFGRIVVHHHQMPHPGCGGAAADHMALDDGHRQAAGRQFGRAGGADNSGADHDDIRFFA